MRPIFLGLIAFLIGLAGWFVSVIFTVITLGKFNDIANFFGLIMAWSIPAGILGELIRWFLKKKK